MESIFIAQQPKDLKQVAVGSLTVLPWPSKNRATDFTAVIFFVKLYLQYKPNVVLGHFGGAVLSLVLSKILSLGSVKVYNIYHTLFSQNLLDYKGSKLKLPLLKARRKLFYKLFIDEIISPSQAGIDDYLKNWPTKKTHVVRNGIGGIFAAKDITNAFQNKILLFLGRLHPSKGVDVLLPVFQKYIEENPNSKLKLILVGNL